MHGPTGRRRHSCTGERDCVARVHSTILRLPNHPKKHGVGSKAGKCIEDTDQGHTTRMVWTYEIRILQFTVVCDGLHMKQRGRM